MPETGDRPAGSWLPVKLHPRSERELKEAKCFVAFVYFALVGFSVYVLFWIFFSGRVEIFPTEYKVDRIEAPSIAICPFDPGTSIVRPNATEISDGPSAHPNTTHVVTQHEAPVSVWFYHAKGPVKLHVEPKDCEYDRHCVCVDLFRVPDPVDPAKSPQLRDHSHVDTRFLGTQGDSSVLEQDFNDRIELRTTLYDPSPDRTLKFGFYDSLDHTPHWIYTHVGSYALGQLLLDKWFVLTHLSWENFQKAARGDMDGLRHVRHIFRYFSQEIRQDPGSEERFRANGLARPNAATRPVVETRISYEMQTFFVRHITASESALSLYSVGVVVMLVLLRRPFVNLLFDVAFPHVEPQEPPRKMSESARSFVACCACGWLPCWGSDEPQGEVRKAQEGAAEPLLGERGGA